MKVNVEPSDIKDLEQTINKLSDEWRRRIQIFGKETVVEGKLPDGKRVRAKVRLKDLAVAELSPLICLYQKMTNGDGLHRWHPYSGGELD